MAEACGLSLDVFHGLSVTFFLMSFAKERVVLEELPAELVPVPFTQRPPRPHFFRSFPPSAAIPKLQGTVDKLEEEKKCAGRRPKE